MQQLLLFYASLHRWELINKQENLQISLKGLLKIGSSARHKDVRAQRFGFNEIVNHIFQESNEKAF